MRQGRWNLGGAMSEIAHAGLASGSRLPERLRRLVVSGVRFVALNKWAGFVTLVVIAMLATYIQIARKGSPSAFQLLPPAEATVALWLLRPPQAQSVPGGNSHSEAATKREIPKNTTMAPGFAIVTAMAARLDDRLRDALTCRTAKKNCSGASLTTLYIMQGTAAVLGLVLVFATALRLSGRWEVAVLTFLLALASLRLGEFSAYPNSYIWGPSFLAAFIYSGSEAMIRGSALLGIIAGACLAIAATFTPLIVFAIPIAAMIFAVAIYMHTRSYMQGIAVGSSLILGTAAVGACLLALDPQGEMIGAAIRAFTRDLSHRIAFNAMDWPTALAGLVLPTPLVGGLIDLVTPAAISNKYAGYSVGAFNYEAVVQIYPAIQRQPGPAFDQLQRLIQSGIAGALPAYLFATPVVLAKVLWINANLIVLLSLINMPRAWRFASEDKRLFVIVPVFATLVTVMLLCVMLSSGHTHTEDAMAPLHAFVVAYAVARF